MDIYKIGVLGFWGFGDLYVEIAVKEHGDFRARRRAFQNSRRAVSFATAALGGNGPGADARWRSDIEDSQSQSGRVFRLRDKGVKPVRGGARGDLFCRVVIETPVNLWL